MRRLVHFTCSFLITLLAGATAYYFTDLHISVSITAAAIGISVFILLPLKQKSAGISGFVCGFIYYLIFCNAVLFPAQRLANGSVHDAVFICTEKAEGYTEYGLVETKLTHVDGKSVIPMKITLFLEDGSPSLEPGCTVLTQVRFKETKEKGIFETNGRLLTANQVSPLFISSGRDHASFFATLRENTSKRLQSILGVENGALTAAIFSGERSGMPPETYRDLRLSGAAHTVCVSGMHMSVLCAFVIKLFGRRRGVAAALPIMLAYCAFTGFNAPAVRALIMTSLALLTVFLVRNYDPLTGMMTALLVITVYSGPFVLITPSLLLSFGACLGLIIFMPKLNGIFTLPSYKRPVLRRIASYFTGCFCASVSAQIVTLPISMLFFGSISFGAVVTSLLILPAVYVCMFGAMFLVPVSFISMPAAIFLGKLLPVPAAEYIRFVCRKISGISWISAGSNAVLLFVSLIIAGIFTILVIKRKPASAIAVFICITLLVAGFSGMAEEKLMSVSTFSTGNSAALTISDGRNCIMIDPVSALQRREISSDLERKGIFDNIRVIFTSPDISAHQIKETKEYFSPDTIITTKDTCEDASVYESGSFTCGAWSVDLYPAGDNYAVLIRCRDISILYLTDIFPLDAALCCKEYALFADILITDTRIYNSAVMDKISYIVIPDKIYVADSIFSGIKNYKDAISLSEKEFLWKKYK